MSLWRTTQAPSNNLATFDVGLIRHTTGIYDQHVSILTKWHNLVFVLNEPPLDCRRLCCI
jgi:hypothetical protein